MNDSARDLFAALRRAAHEDEIATRFLGVAAELLGNPEMVASTWHPLGFMHLGLFADGPRSLRMHVWPRLGPGVPGPTAASPIHDHVWDLRSYVLCGSLTNHVVELSETFPADATHRIGLVRYNGRENVIEPTHRFVRWHSASQQLVRAGEQYHLPPGVFHFTEPRVERPIATLVAATVVNDTAPRTLVPVGESEGTTVREACPPEEVTRQLSDVLTAIDDRRR